MRDKIGYYEKSLYQTVKGKIPLYIVTFWYLVMWGVKLTGTGSEIGRIEFWDLDISPINKSLR